MYLSNYKVVDMVDLIKMEVDSYNQVPESIVLMAYNACMAQLYRAVIQEQAAHVFTSGLTAASTGLGDGVKGAMSVVVDLSEISVPESQAGVVFEDVVKVYTPTVDYTKSTAKSGHLVANTYYKAQTNDQMNIICDEFVPNSGAETTKDYKLTVVYNVMPKIVTKENLADEDTLVIPLPNEYVPMAYAAVRGECYKWINQDALSAKWISDYNAQAESFRDWVSSTKPQFGA